MFSTNVMAADPQVVTANFKNLLFVGCIPSVVLETPISSYAQKMNMREADNELKDFFLFGKVGSAYILQNGGYPLVIAQSYDGVCTVAARKAPDINDLVRSIEAMLLGSDSPIKKLGESDSLTKGGISLLKRSYSGTIKGKPVKIVFSTSSSDKASAQAMLTVWNSTIIR